MKKIFINSLIAATVLFVAGCEKSKEYKAPFEISDASQSKLKFIYASAYLANPGVQISIDGIRVSNLITGRTPFPGGGFNTSGSNFPDYLRVAVGARNIKISIPKRLTNIDSIVLYSTQVTLEANRNYTLNVMDTLTLTKSTLVSDTILQPTDGTVKYRFINLMPNAPRLDLYFGTKLMATNIQYNTEGITFVMDVPALNEAWFIRETGTLPTSTALATYSSANTIRNQRMFTAFAMGYKGSAVTNTRPYIAFTINL
ncbi:MAG: DUF4397 domain-containing protein [Ferruginibacter sp.]